MAKYFSLLFLIILASCKHEATIHPERKNIVETVYASGKIIAENEYNLYALSNGTVIKKLAREGDSVKKGQVIYIINNDAPTAKLDAARSNYENAQSNISDQSRVLKDLKLSMDNAEARYRNDSLQYLRLKTLMEQGIGTQNNLDNARTTFLISENQKKSAEEKYYSTVNELNVSFQNAKSQLAGAKNDLDNYFIRSEEDGRVYQLMKEAGEAVKLNDAVALMGDASKRIIRLAVDQQDISRIKTGQEVLLKADVTGNTIYKATISRIYPTMNEVDQTFRVDAVFAESTQQHFIHSSVEANIIIQKKNNALVIPRSALTATDSVQVKESGKTKTVLVQTGIRTLNDVEIIAGLDETSTIIPIQK